MNKAERAKKIHQILNELFPDPEIPLTSVNTYTFMIAVLLSAQCTDERVNKVTPPLFERASNPYEMLKLDISEIENYIRSCGIYKNKAKNIYELSRVLVDEYEGEVPEALEELERLPGVGHKTASVVVSQAYGIPAFPVDTHIFRCAKRWKLSRGKDVVQVEKDLKKIFPKESWNKLHLQIIYFARKYCPAKAHDEANCPICSWI